MKYVLDACALMACLNGESEAVRVKPLFDRATTLARAADGSGVSIHMSIVNLIEVYYGMIQKTGNTAEADRIMREVTGLPISVIDTITGAVYRETSRLKAAYSISLADAFACATALSLSAVLVTKDGEIKDVEQHEPLSVFWIR